MPPTRLGTPPASRHAQPLPTATGDPSPATNGSWPTSKATTRLRKGDGIQMARIILGRSTAFTTEVYAEAGIEQRG